MLGYKTSCQLITSGASVKQGQQREGGIEHEIGFNHGSDMSYRSLTNSIIRWSGRDYYCCGCVGPNIPPFCHVLWHSVVYGRMLFAKCSVLHSSSIIIIANIVDYGHVL